MAKKSKFTKRAGMIAALAIMAASMSTTAAYAADLTPGNPNTTYEGPGTTTKMTIDGNSVDLATPTAKDRTTLKYYGVDKYQKDPNAVKIYAYHIVEANYNQYGFLGWTETKAASDITKFESFQKTTDNVVQVIVDDPYQFIDASGNKTNDITKRVSDNPTYNKGKVITSENVTDLARALMNADTRAKFERVELTWSEDQKCYMSPMKGDANTLAEAGMYLVLVEKEDRGVIYNPVIISNDYADANVARSLSNYLDGNGQYASLHDNGAFSAKDFPYESGISLNNDAFVAYGSVNPKDVENSLVTGDNKDKSPQEQEDYTASHQTVVYYKDSFKNGNVYSLYNKHNPDGPSTMSESTIETMALRGVAYAKKSSIPLEKNIRNASVPKEYDDSKLEYSKYDDVSEGDTVQYDIFTQIPYYADGYFKDEDKFLFKITDTQHEGLAAVKRENIKVYTANSDQVDAQNIAVDVAQPKNELPEGTGNYKITINDDNSFSVNFDKEYCLANPGKMIIVSYTTTVTEEAAKGLNGNPNEVFLEYTTLPTSPDNNKPSRGHKFDFAVQYTFSPTAFKLAEDGTISAVDGKNVVTTEDQADIAKGEKASLPLAGAKFKLQRVGTHYNNNSNAKIVNIAPDTTKWKAETTELEKDPKTSWNGYQTWFLTSDENGMIKFDSALDGIDEGIYTLQEVEAPKDYTINDKIYVIEVNPKFDTNTQQFIGTDVKIGTNDAGDIATYDIDGATFVDGTNYEYDEYGKLLTEYTYSEWVSNQIDNYDGNVDNLKAANTDQDATATGIHNTVVKYEVNADTNVAEKVAQTDLQGIINTKLTRLPSTGGIGTIGITVGGFALMGAAAYIVSKSKKNDDK